MERLCQIDQEISEERIIANLRNVNDQSYNKEVGLNGWDAEVKAAVSDASEAT